MEKDWNLSNIVTIIHEKRVKVETIASEIGISKGEFSKIVSGQRQDYFKHLPKIAESLGVSFHQLVSPLGITMNNIGEVKEQSGNVNTVFNNTDMQLYERLISECKEKDLVKNQVINDLKESVEYWKDKYYRLKERKLKI